MDYVVVDGVTFEVGTLAQIEDAEGAMRAAGVDGVRVYRSPSDDPDSPDSIALERWIYLSEPAQACRDWDPGAPHARMTR